MARPNISEFSFGYAVTDELIHGLGIQVTAAPVFPSLYAEGQAGGGWDLKLKRKGLPLFLQFKLSHYMKGPNAREARDGHFEVPYYRMHLRPRNVSHQHKLLVALALAGNQVYYVAPGFHEPQELDSAYLSKTLKARCLWMDPTNIGPLADDHEHYVAFKIPGKALFCSSEPHSLGSADFESFLSAIRLAWEGNDRTLADNVKVAAAALEERTRDAETQEAVTASSEEEPSVDASDEWNLRPALDRLAYLSHSRLNAQLIVLSPSDGAPDGA